MTESEAIERLKCLRLYMKINDRHSDSKFLDEDYEANAMAIKALGKQIPKKPDIEGDGYVDGHLVYDTWICPCCNKYYEIEYDEYDYCPNCGQRIDWSE